MKKFFSILFVNIILFVSLFFILNLFVKEIRRGHINFDLFSNKQINNLKNINLNPKDYLESYPQDFKIIEKNEETFQEFCGEERVEFGKII